MTTTQSELSRPSSTSDSFGRYYTEDWISQTLVDAMTVRRPKLLVELGTGEGSLAAVAAKKWQVPKIVTVDLDQKICSRADKLGTNRSAHLHHTHDALDARLAEKIGVGLESVDVAVCNPPYVRPRWRASFGQILEGAGLSGSLKSVKDAGADLLFIAQNLRLLKRGGKLGLILPDGLVTGEKFQGVRKTLLGAHRIEQVLQLPRKVFAKTEAQTYLVILAKHAGQTELVHLREMQADGQLSESIYVDAELARHRLDFRFHQYATTKQVDAPRERTKSLQILDVTESLRRGGVASNQVREQSWPIFHLGDFPPLDNCQNFTVPRTLRVNVNILPSLPQTTCVAGPGDILVARIGRNLQNKICMVNRGHCILSDCVFRLRVSPEFRSAVFASLTSSDGRNRLQASSHGVGAAYVSSSDLLSLRFDSNLEGE